MNSVFKNLNRKFLIINSDARLLRISKECANLAIENQNFASWNKCLFTGS